MQGQEFYLGPRHFSDIFHIRLKFAMMESAHPPKLKSPAVSCPSFAFHQTSSQSYLRTVCQVFVLVFVDIASCTVCSVEARILGKQKLQIISRCEWISSAIFFKTGETYFQLFSYLYPVIWKSEASIPWRQLLWTIHSNSLIWMGLEHG